MVADHLGWTGTVLHGVARLFLQWIPAIDKERYNLTLCVLRKENALGEHFYRRGIDIEFFNRSKYDPLTILDFIRIIKKKKIDLMHIQGYGSITFGRIAKMVTGVPVIVHYHDTSLYYPWITRLADGLLNRFTDEAIACSKLVLNFIPKHRSSRGLDTGRIRVLHNSVALDEFKIPEQSEILSEKNRLGLDPGTKIIGTVTRLYETKGIRYFIEAAAVVRKSLPGAKFLIVGDGPMRRDLEELAKTLGLGEDVIFTGFVDNVSNLLATFDMMIFSSYAAEGLPLTVLEAMAMGKPIVATDIVEILEDGESGLLVPGQDSKAIADSIISLLKDQGMMSRLGKNAREESKKYDVNVYVRKLERIYEEVILRSKRGH